MNKLKWLTPISALTSATIAMTFVAPITSCGNNNIKVEKVEFNQQYSWIQTNSTREFGQEVQILPNNASNKSLTWTISDESGSQIAEIIDETTGAVKGLSEGYAKLTCTSKDGSEQSSEQWIVVGNYIELTDFKINPTQSIEIGGQGKINTKFTPADATTALTQDILWTSSNTDIVEVDQQGKITAKNTIGQAIITAIPYDWDYATNSRKLKESLKQTCDVTVNYSQISRITINPSSTTVEVGTSFGVVPTIHPFSAKQEWDYTVLDTTIVSYDKTTMKATALSPGITSIIFYDIDQTVFASCKITVQEKIIPVESISITNTPPNPFYTNTTWTPTIEVLPTDATTKGYWLTSDNTDVAYIDSTGKTVVAKSNGDATIIVHSNDGKHTNQQKITVTKQTIEVDSVEIDPPTADCPLQGNITLRAKISPENASDKTLTWSSDRTEVATVDQTGKVSGLKEGTATISATSNNGKIGTCTVTVKNEDKPITGIEIDSEITLCMTETPFLKATITPSEATYPAVGWYSCDPNIVTFNYKSTTEATLVTHATGSTNVYAYALDGSSVVSNPCHVTVDYDWVTSITLPQKSISIVEGGSAKLSYPTIEPAASNQEVVWYSDMPNVVSVDQTGHLTANAPGIATIYCTTKGTTSDYQHLSDSCVVTVLKDIIHVSDIKLSFYEANVMVGEWNYLPWVDYIPDTATQIGVHWTCESWSVQFTGPIPRFRCLYPDDDTINCTPLDNPQAAKTLAIHAKAPDPTWIQVKVPKQTLMVGETTQIKYQVFPEGVSQEVTFKSWDTKILDVDQNSGVVKGVSPGATKIEVISKAKESIKATIDMVCIAPSITTDSWENVCYYANKGSKALHDYYSIDCERNPFLPNTLIGYERIIKINGLDHRVRIIDENHDVVAGTNNKAALTFEMVTLLSKADGNPITSVWDPTNNYNYTNSVLRKNLTGEGTATGKQVWTNSAFSMLPAMLQSSIKTVNKKVATYNFESKQYEVLETGYNDKLFPLTYTEMAQTGSSSVKIEGSAYTYWIYNNQPDARVKRSLNNDPHMYWLASPNLIQNTQCCGVTFKGAITDSVQLNRIGTSISFGFCI